MSTGHYSGPPLASLTECILNVQQPVAKRTIAAFHLRTLGSLEAAEVIGKGMCSVIPRYILSALK